MKVEFKTRRGFTLMELMTVLIIMTILSAIALPSIIGMFNAGSDAQAYNVLVGQLASARALAIRTSNYTGVHVQMVDPASPQASSKSKMCVAIVSYNRANGTFALAAGHEPAALPGTAALGQVAAPYVGTQDYQNLDGDPLDSNSNAGGFLTFTLVFSPSGTVVTTVEDHKDYNNNPSNNITFDTAGGLFNGPARIWAAQANNDHGVLGVSAVTLFDYVEFAGRADGAKRALYLNQSGQFLPINVYTGQLFPRK